MDFYYFLILFFTIFIVIYYRIISKVKYAIVRTNELRKNAQILSKPFGGIFNFFKISTKIFCRMFCISLKQKYASNLKHIGLHTYELHYTFHNKIYRLILHKNTGPSPVIMATDNHENDITHKIIEYAGPSSDFHGAQITPREIGCQAIELCLSNGNIIQFSENEIIRFD